MRVQSVARSKNLVALLYRCFLSHLSLCSVLKTIQTLLVGQADDDVDGGTESRERKVEC